MSSAGDNLETLTDRQLRERCLYYGLQNVPITDTTRKLVINKLRSCLSNEQIKKTALKKRQSTQLDSASSPNVEPVNEKKKEKFTLKNRHTLAAKIVSTDVLQQMREDSLPLKRRSERKSIYSLLEPERKSEPNFNFHSEETNKQSIDDDVVFVTEHTRKSLSPTITSAAPQPYSSIPVLSTKQLRKSRSPSLSKSVVVTTSYGKEQKSATPILEIELHMDQSPEEYEELIKNKIGNKKSTTSNTITTLHNPDPIFIEADEPYPTNYKPIYPVITANTPIKYSSPDISRRSSSKVKALVMPSRPQYLESDDDENIEAHAPFLSDFAKRLSRLKAEPIELGIDKKEDFNMYKTIPISSAYNEVDKKLKRVGSYGRLEGNEKEPTIVLRKREIFIILFLFCLSIILVTYYYPFKL